ncbi:MAG: glycoside hydrolase family 32 protein, partial [Gemmatimonadota bacterium]|nr:glycoside hydrolase family 32 protein [Gemmatimonadota bacterium]
LLFCSHLQGSQYYIGEVRNERFCPEIHGRMSWEGGHLGGPRTLLDANDRRVFFDWIRDLRGNERERESGWSGAMTVPRLLSPGPDGHLQIDPVPELEVLRLDGRRHGPIDIAADSEVALEGIGGDCLELAIEIDPREAREIGVKVRRSPGGEEETAVSCDVAASVLRVDVSRSSLDRAIRYTRYRSLQPHLSEREQYVTAQEGPLDLAPGEPLVLRIFLDRSILEVFANRRQCVTQRIYPTRTDSMGVSLFARGGAARFKSLQAWSLAPARM